jgi:hypothetical protein
MNTIHRVGLTIAGVVALLVVGGAFVVQGYTSAQADAAQAAAAQQTPWPTSTTDASLDPVTVYIEPAPTQPPVVVTKPAPPVAVSRPDPTPAPPTPAPPTQPDPTPPVIHIIVPSPSGHGDDGGGDD